MNILIISNDKSISEIIKNSLANLNLSNNIKIYGLENYIISNMSKDIDITFIDIDMNNFDFDIISQINDKAKHSRIILMSQFYDYYSMRQALIYSIDDYILKPINSSELLTSIRNSFSKINESRKEQFIKEICSSQKQGIDSIDTILNQYLFKKEMSLNFLADKLNYSPGYLSKIFKKKYGIPFQNYILNKRLEKASYLLISTNLKNYDISEKIGFDSVYYFCTKFKQKYQKSPREYKAFILDEKKRKN